ncbi:TPA: hypothetical protein O4E86_000902 [Klebsiella oxytoca]|nr:hypothetical protein [Klebsiella oxytoca]HCZ8654409.1 hypothetical protein [Klebsiella oxytoca]
MDLLEVSSKVERIELLAKFAHADHISDKEKTIALVWIGEIAEEVIQEIRKRKTSQPGEVSDGRGCLQ